MSKTLGAIYALIFALGFAAGAIVPSDVPGGAPTILATETVTTDIQITGTAANKNQTLMTTDPVEFDGGPVLVEFTAEYANMIPSPTTNLNGLGFDLMIDGARVERMTLFGAHQQVNIFGPINLSDYLVDERAIPAGTHTVGINVWKWSPVQDGYLKYSAGYQPGYGMPIRLTVTDLDG